MTAVPAPLPPEPVVPAPAAGLNKANLFLSRELRRIGRFATVVTVVASPSIFYFIHHRHHERTSKAVFLTAIACLVFRGAVELVIRRTVPWPTLFGTTDQILREEDMTNRRRWWTWRSLFIYATFVETIVTLVFVIQYLGHWWHGDAVNPIDWVGTNSAVFGGFHHIFKASSLTLVAQVFFLFAANMLLFMGPLLAMGVSQIKAFEPGDADWGVKLDDVRGQDEAKEEIRRIVTLWQSGEIFEKAGGKRERGLLFLGAPGTGKTMMAKAIATGFNSPFVTIPGSGFAQAFMGIDAVIVRVLAMRAKRLARKWGGNCIVFIDEIDAVGMRRSALGGGPTMEPTAPGFNPLDDHSPTFYGHHGALNSSGDLIVESPAWRDYMFRLRADDSPAAYPRWYRSLANIVNQGVFPGMTGGGGQLALNQLLVVMDGVDNPPFFKRIRRKLWNTTLDAVFVIPRRLRRLVGGICTALVAIFAVFLLVDQIFTLSNASPPIQALTPKHSHDWTVFYVFIAAGMLSMTLKWYRSLRANGTVELRLGRSRPAGGQIYFIGATNVALQALDPALTRAGRMGRHVWFRTPTKDDRKDIFDLYLTKVAHDPDLDTEERRDEIARITNGYSPAMIDQICSMALTNAHHEGRAYFEWEDLVDAMTVIESGSAVDVNFIEEDQYATAIHEAGHAAAAHVYRPEVESSRLSIRMRGRSGGHHQSFEKEERFGKFQGMLFNELIHDVGAMAAELVFFGQNSNGVGGDMAMSSGLASRMVSGWGMSPLPLDLDGKTFPELDEQRSYDLVLRRLTDLGNRMMSSAGDAPNGPKRTYAAQFLGLSLVYAYNLVLTNKEKVKAVADEVMVKKELFGNDLVRLLDEQNFVKPEIDWTADETWPNIMNWSREPRDARPFAADNDDEPKLRP